MVTWTAYNGLESMDVIGIVRHAELQLRMVTWTAYSGLESMDVTGLITSKFLGFDKLVNESKGTK